MNGIKVQQGGIMFEFYYIKKIIKLFKRLFVEFFKEDFFCHWRESYSQEGEDLILARIFDKKKRGFYLDVGAYHPISYSNTYYFYERGWNGINIDATPGSMDLFNKLRPTDINIEAMIFDSCKKLDFNLHNAPGLNNIDLCKDNVDYRTFEENGFKVLNKVSIQAQSLSDILKSRLKPGQQIDFMDVDVEGAELNVLKSFDWDNLRPNVVLVEDNSSWGEDSEIVSFLKTKDYVIYAKTPRTIIFKHKFFDDMEFDDEYKKATNKHDYILPIKPILKK